MYILFHPHKTGLTISCQAEQPSDSIYITSFKGLRLLAKCKAYMTTTTLARFPSLLNERVIVNVSPHGLADLLPTVADPVQLNNYMGNVTGFSPFVYHEPSLRLVRHPEVTSTLTYILAFFGPVALGGLLALSCVLFCKYRTRVRQFYIGLRPATRPVGREMDYMNQEVPAAEPAAPSTTYSTSAPHDNAVPPLYPTA